MEGNASNIKPTDVRVKKWATSKSGERKKRRELEHLMIITKKKNIY